MLFIHELEHKLYQKVSVNGTSVTYDTLIRNKENRAICAVR